MQKIILADTSCLIALDNVGELGVLKKIFGQVIITPEVKKEFGKEPPEWFIIENFQDYGFFNFISEFVDSGETSIIALAFENPTSLVVLDDLKARNIANKLGLKVTGIFGVLLIGKELGVISQVKPILQKLKLVSFRLSKELESKILEMAGEN